MATITCEGLVKRFGSTTVIHGLDLAVGDGEFIALVGPSGCGKSTILRMVAGLEEASAGEIRLGRRAITDLPPRDRNVAMVFQDYALYPHMTVAENIGFGLMIRGMPEAARRAAVLRAAAILEIEPLLDRRPAALSGGQRQRVAMGRCLVRQPEAFLFDEPLSNLDAKLRGTMRIEIKRFHREGGTTSLYVTHDQIEAMTLADRIVCLDKGRIAQQGTPRDLYDRPVNRFVAGFIGSPAMNFLPARLMTEGGAPRLLLPDGQSLPVAAASAARLAGQDGREVVLGLRPEHLTDPDAARRPGLPAAFELLVEMVEPLGADTLLHGRMESHAVVARCSPFGTVAAGPTSLIADMAQAHLFDRATSVALH